MLHPLIHQERQRIGKLIAQKRVQKGLSLRTMAMRLKMSHNYIHLLEKGYCKISLKAAKRLSRLFKIPFEELYWGEGKNNYWHRLQLGKELVLQRISQGWSVEKIAALLNEKVKTVYTVEEGYLFVPLANIDRWSEIYRLPLHVLRGDYFKENMTNHIKRENQKVEENKQ